MKYLDNRTPGAGIKLFKNYRDLKKEFVPSEFNGGNDLLYLSEGLAKRYEGQKIVMLIDEIGKEGILENLGDIQIPQTVRLILIVNPVLSNISLSLPTSFIQVTLTTGFRSTIAITSLAQFIANQENEKKKSGNQEGKSSKYAEKRVTSEEEKAERMKSVQDQIEAFVKSKTLELSFPPELSSFERMLVHEVAETMGLLHESQGKGAERRIVVRKKGGASREEEEGKKEAKGKEKKGAAKKNCDKHLLSETVAVGGNYGSDVKGVKPMFFDVDNEEGKLDEALAQSLCLLGDDVTILHAGLTDSMKAKVNKYGKEQGGSWECYRAGDFYGWEAEKVVAVTSGYSNMELITRAKTKLIFILIRNDGYRNRYSATQEQFQQAVALGLADYKK